MGKVGNNIDFELYSTEGAEPEQMELRYSQDDIIREQLKYNQEFISKDQDQIVHDPFYGLYVVPDMLLSVFIGKKEKADVELFGTIFNDFRFRPQTGEFICDKEGNQYEVKKIMIKPTIDGKLHYHYYLRKSTTNKEEK